MSTDRGLQYPLKQRDIDCPTASPPCTCELGWSCIETARTRTTCATTSCIKDPEIASESGGTNVGVIVGPVLAVIVLVSAVLGWLALRTKRAKDLRRLQKLEERARKLDTLEKETYALRSGDGSIGRFATVLDDSTLTVRQPAASGDGGRSPTFAVPHLAPIGEHQSTPTSTIRAYKTSTVNLDPWQHDTDQPRLILKPAASRTAAGDADPFSDAQSVQTTLSLGGLSLLSQSTNVIPIAYIDGPSSAGVSQAFQEAVTGRSMRGSFSPLAGPPSPVLTSPRHSDAQTDRHSLKSVAPSLSTFNSGLWSLDRPTIERANVVHIISSPSASTPLSTGATIASQGSDNSPGLPTVPPTIHAGLTPTTQSPLSLLPVTRSSLSTASTSPPSASSRRNPFEIFPRPPQTPVTPTRLRLAGSPGGSYRSVSPSPPHAPTSNDEEDHLSLYSLGPEGRPPLPDLHFPPRATPARAAEQQQQQRPPSTTASIQSTAIFHATKRVQIGREDEGPSEALLRSGSLTRTSSQKMGAKSGAFPHPPPPIPDDPPAPTAAAPRDRTSEQTNYSIASYSILGGFPFILPSAQPPI